MLVEVDGTSRQDTQDLLRRDDYWTMATDDAAAADRVAWAGAVDLLIVDLDLGVLEPVPRSERRKGDLAVPEAAPYWRGGYAVARPLHVDSSCARFPLVVLKVRSDDEGHARPCRLGLIDYLPKASQPGQLAQGLDAVFRSLVEPASRAARPGLPGDGRSEAMVGRAARSGYNGGSGDWARRFVPFQAVPKALRTALLVDPDVAHRQFVRGLLVEHGFEVFETASSTEALELATARRPWLIISEARLPDEDGLKLCARIRRHGLLRRTPLAFLSTWDDPDRRYESLRRGADDFLVKPITARELIIRLELILKRYTDLQPGAEEGYGFSGSLELVGAAGLLQFCHLGRLSGALTVRQGALLVCLQFSSGEIVDASGLHVARTVRGQPRPETIVHALLGWDRGKFEFEPEETVAGRPIAESFEHLLLEGCRQLDERTNGRSPGM
jgi:DNA-binding response OmpR family regulator